MSRPPSPTDTEWNTFQVMANPEFVNIRSSKPSFNEKPEKRFVDDKSEDEHSRSPSPVALSEALDSISVVAEKMAHATAFKPVMPALQEEDEDDQKSESSHSSQASKRSEHKASIAPSAVSVPQVPEPRYEPLRATHVASRENSIVSEPEPDFDIPKQIPKTTKSTPEDVKRRAKEMTEADILLEKEGLLAEIELLQKQEVIKLQRELTIHDSLEEIQFQQDRAMSNQNAMQTVEMAKGGIKVMSTLMESAFRYMGLKLMDGFSGHLCKDMTRFNRPLTKMYRKQWRGVHMSPETEMAVIVFGAVLVTIMHNKGLGMFANMMPGIGASAPAATPPLARPVVPPPVPAAPAPSQNIPAQTQNIPTVPVMRRPRTADPEPSPKPEIQNPKPEPATKSVTLNHHKPAKKRNDEPVLNL